MPYSPIMFVFVSLTCRFSSALSIIPTTDTLHQNPQYQITIDSSGNLSSIFVEVMVESQRALRNFFKTMENYLPIGFIIYKVSCVEWVRDT